MAEGSLAQLRDTERRTFALFIRILYTPRSGVSKTKGGIPKRSRLSNTECVDAPESLLIQVGVGVRWGLAVPELILYLNGALHSQSNQFPSSHQLIRTLSTNAECNRWKNDDG